MIAAEGILTARGGVSARTPPSSPARWARSASAAPAALQIDYDKQDAVGRRQDLQGRRLAVDRRHGGRGLRRPAQDRRRPRSSQVLVDDDAGARRRAATYKNFAQLMKWCATGHPHVRSAPTPTRRSRPRNAIAFGAKGIGLTPHRAHVLRGRPHRRDARDDPRRNARGPRRRRWPSCCRYQREDFVGIFKALKGYPATIRFLDPPLHEFLPHDGRRSSTTWPRSSGVPVEKIQQRVHELHEFNPMLGFRGCRLGISYPEISEMQARAVFEAAADVQKKGIKVQPEIMIPLVGFKKELDLQVEIVHRGRAARCRPRRKVKIKYLVGTMIEVPRGAADGRRDRADGRVLQLRHQRPDADHARHEPRRLGLVPPALRRRPEIVKKNPFATIDQTGRRRS